MGAARAFLSVALVAIAVPVQLAVLTRLPLPGADPDLVLVVVVAVALVRGAPGGAIFGFAAGLVLDLAPPGDQVAGRSALLLTLLGYTAGFLRRDVRRSPLLLVIAAALLAGVELLAGTALGLLLRDPRADWFSALALLPTHVIYAGVLIPLVVPAVMWLDRRAAPQPSDRLDPRRPRRSVRRLPVSSRSAARLSRLPRKSAR